jgi:hypothetical protein
MNDMNDTNPPPIPGRLLDMLDEVILEIEEARPVPLSNSIMLNKDEIVDKMEKVRQALPEELRAARWMVRERESYIARTNEKAREMLLKARDESQRLVAESYIVAEAVAEANTLVRAAENDARRTRLEAEDHAERRLIDAEAVLAESLRFIQESRAVLHESRPPAPPAPISE